MDFVTFFCYSFLTKTKFISLKTPVKIWSMQFCTLYVNSAAVKYSYLSKCRKPCFVARQKTENNHFTKLSTKIINFNNSLRAKKFFSKSFNNGRTLILFLNSFILQVLGRRRRWILTLENFLNIHFFCVHFFTLLLIMDFTWRKQKFVHNFYFSTNFIFMKYETSLFLIFFFTEH